MLHLFLENVEKWGANFTCKPLCVLFIKPTDNIKIISIHMQLRGAGLQGSPATCEPSRLVNTGGVRLENCTSAPSCRRHRRQEAALTSCPHQYWDQQNTCIFHLLWLHFPPTSQPDEFSYPAYQRGGGVGGERQRDPRTGSPAGWVSTFYVMRALFLSRIDRVHRECIKWEPPRESLLQTV